MTDGSQTLRAVDKTFSILEFLYENDGGRVTEIADVLDLPPSTVHTHLSTHEENQFVVKEGDVYHLGMDFLRFGNQVKYRKRAYSLAEDYLEDLAAGTDCRAVFLVEEHGYGVYVHERSGEHASWRHARAGQKEYLHVLAAGKAILAHLPTAAVESIIERHGLPARTDRSITDRTALFDELETIEERGVAFNRGENVERIAAIGAPVMDPDERVVGAISLSGAANRLTEARLEGELEDALLGAINELELELSLT